MWSRVLWFDFDHDDLGAALIDARRLVAVLLRRYARFEEDNPGPSSAARRVSMSACPDSQTRSWADISADLSHCRPPTG